MFVIVFETFSYFLFYQVYNDIPKCIFYRFIRNGFTYLKPFIYLKYLYIERRKTDKTVAYALSSWDLTNAFDNWIFNFLFAKEISWENEIKHWCLLNRNEKYQDTSY